MKRKLSLTLKSLSALFVSLALVSSTAGPASAEVGYLAEKCSGSKYVCSNWSSAAQPSDGSWKFEGCYESNVSFKFQVKKGKKWKTVKGASGKGKTDSRCSAPKYPYLVSVSVNEKSKGTKTYRFVVTEKKKKPYYANFKVKVSEYVLEASPTPTPALSWVPAPRDSATSTYNVETYNYIYNLSSRIKPTRPLWNLEPRCDRTFGYVEKINNFARMYRDGVYSEAIAISKAEAELVSMVGTRCFIYK
jgi:hypothetical protein